LKPFARNPGFSYGLDSRKKEEIPWRDDELRQCRFPARAGDFYIMAVELRQIFPGIYGKVKMTLPAGFVRLDFLLFS